MAGGAVQPVPNMAGEETPFDLWPEVRRTALCDAAGPPPRALALAIRGWAALPCVPIERCGRRQYALTADLSESGSSSARQRVIVEVCLAGDVREVRSRRIMIARLGE